MIEIRNLRAAVDASTTFRKIGILETAFSIGKKKESIVAGNWMFKRSWTGRSGAPDPYSLFGTSWRAPQTNNIETEIAITANAIPVAGLP